MSKTRVKICGLTNATDRDVAIDAGADAVGFISQVPVDTPRSVTADTARRLVEGVPPFVTSVLVTMPEDPTGAIALQTKVGADAIQIHGSLSPTAVATVRDQVDVPVIAAVDIDDSTIDAYAASADAVLVDSTDEDGAGGTGEPHDWERSRRLREQFDTPLILAGGLTPANVEDAICAVDPFGVDTASGVEKAGGQKDHDALKLFLQRATTVEVPA